MSERKLDHLYDTLMEMKEGDAVRLHQVLIIVVLELRKLSFEVEKLQDKNQEKPYTKMPEDPPVEEIGEMGS
jgi:hypothetical protein